MKENPVLSAVVCGAICTAVQFCLIPIFLMRGIPDIVWALLMLLLPAVVSVLLLRHHSPKSVLWSFLTQIVLGLLFAAPIGRILGYRLGNIGDDLFDYIAYLMLVFGWSAGASLVQFFTLWNISRRK